MTAGSIVGTAATVAWSQVHTVAQLYVALVAIGIASAMVLYEPAFAIVVHHVPSSSRPNALLSITIVAGFASSIFFPLTGLLVGPLGWRGALLALATLYAAIAIPLHALALPGRTVLGASLNARTTATARRPAWADRGFWMLAAAFTAHTAAVAVVAVHLVTYLTEFGHPLGFAATIAGLLGVLSVAGRVVTTALRRRRSTAAVTAVVFAWQAAAIALLPAVGTTGVGAAACVVVFGFGFGVATIARPAMLAERYGVVSYAGIAGVLALPVTIAKAAAPLAAALAAGAAGYPLVMLAAAGACVLAAIMLALGSTNTPP
jgi:MFS family permease